MKIQVNTDHNIEGSDALVAMVETQIHLALDRYNDRLTRIEVHLGDQDGSKSGVDKRCLLEARPIGRDPVVVTGISDTSEQACHDATRKMQRVLEGVFGRLEGGHDAKETIRQNEPESKGIAQ